MRTLARAAALISLLASCDGDDSPFHSVTTDGGPASSGGAGAGGAAAGLGSGGTSLDGTGGALGGGGGVLGGAGGVLTGTGGGQDAGMPTDASPAMPRRFRLAATGAQLVITGPALGLSLTPADLAKDADVVAIHQEFYGVPWRELEAGSPPPAEWSAQMEQLARSAADGRKPVFLSITMLNGQRERLAATTTIEGGQVKTQDDSSERCYDFSTAADGPSKRAAYLRYVELMLGVFQPAYLNIAVEVNLFFEKCPTAAAALREVANAAYDAAKAKSPGTVVFPSFQIDHLYGFSKDSCPDQTARDACFDAAYTSLRGMKRDRFAISSYPYLSGFTDPGALPPDWFTRGPARQGERPLVAETGWLSTPLVAKARDGTCQRVFAPAETTAASYLARVLADADRANLDLVTWWSDRDLLTESVMTDCPCHLDQTWCSVVDAFRGQPTTSGLDTGFLGEVLMKAFGTMGIRLYDGTPKPELYSLWSSALGRPLMPSR